MDGDAKGYVFLWFGCVWFGCVWLCLVVFVFVFGCCVWLCLVVLLVVLLLPACPWNGCPCLSCAFLLIFSFSFFSTFFSLHRWLLASSSCHESHGIRWKVYRVGASRRSLFRAWTEGQSVQRSDCSSSQCDEVAASDWCK